MTSNCQKMYDIAIIYLIHQNSNSVFSNLPEIKGTRSDQNAGIIWKAASFVFKAIWTSISAFQIFILTYMMLVL